VTMPATLTDLAALADELADALISIDVLEERLNAALGRIDRLESDGRYHRQQLETAAGDIRALERDVSGLERESLVSRVAALEYRAIP
jgi:chromosome segregation ATPase